MEGKLLGASVQLPQGWGHTTHSLIPHDMVSSVISYNKSITFLVQ